VDRVTGPLKFWTLHATNSEEVKVTDLELKSGTQFRTPINYFIIGN